MIGIRNLLLTLVLAIMLVFGCHHVGSLGGDAGPVECNLGEYSGNFRISPQSDGADIAGYTSISGDLHVEYFLEELDNEDTSYTDLSDLICLTSVDGSNLFEDDDFHIINNPALPDCEVCELLDQLTSEPATIEVHDNLADSCTPVPGNCPP